MNKCDLCKFSTFIVACVRPSLQIPPNITIPSIPSRFVSENNHLQNPIHFNIILVYVRPMIRLADDTAVAYWIRRRINLIWRSWHKCKYAAYHYFIVCCESNCFQAIHESWALILDAFHYVLYHWSLTLIWRQPWHHFPLVYVFVLVSYWQCTLW